MHYNQTLDLLHGLLEFKEFQGAQTERAQVDEPSLNNPTE